WHQRAQVAHRCAQTPGGLVLSLVAGGGIDPELALAEIERFLGDQPASAVICLAGSLLVAASQAASDCSGAADFAGAQPWRHQDFVDSAAI
ncbi:MAG: hypothetical protein MUQ10_15560, partial [Anaerolineae bacterium]|nr:hypothetical protein [Anaerolineae bacterium]